MVALAVSLVLAFAIALVDDDLGFVTQIYMDMGAITKYSAGGYHSNAEGVDTDDFTHIKDVMIAHSSERWGARVETNVLEDAMANWAPALNALMNSEPYTELKKYTRSTFDAIDEIAEQLRGLRGELEDHPSRVTKTAVDKWLAVIDQLTLLKHWKYGYNNGPRGIVHWLVHAKSSNERLEAILRQMAATQPSTHFAGLIRRTQAEPDQARKWEQANIKLEMLLGSGDFEGVGFLQSMDNYLDKVQALEHWPAVSSWGNLEEVFLRVGQ